MMEEFSWPKQKFGKDGVPPWQADQINLRQTDIPAQEKLDILQKRWLVKDDGKIKQMKTEDIKPPYSKNTQYTVQLGEDEGPVYSRYKQDQLHGGAIYKNRFYDPKPEARPMTRLGKLQHRWQRLPGPAKCLIITTAVMVILTAIFLAIVTGLCATDALTGQVCAVLNIGQSSVKVTSEAKFNVSKQSTLMSVLTRKPVTVLTRKPVTICEDNPCENGGTCQENADGDIKCECASGYIGALCEDFVSVTSETIEETDETFKDTETEVLPVTTIKSKVARVSTIRTEVWIIAVLLAGCSILIIAIAIRKKRSNKKRKNIGSG